MSAKTQPSLGSPGLVPIKLIRENVWCGWFPARAKSMQHYRVGKKTSIQGSEAPHAFSFPFFFSLVFI